VSAAAGHLAATPSAPPAPQPGSPRYFALLYTPAAARAALATLLALADEISSRPGLDHSVAHARLDWWRAEAARFSRGEPQHPWLRTLAPPPGAAQCPELAALVDAAAIDLASATFGAAAGAATHRAALQAVVFEQAGAVLRTAAGVPPAPPNLQRTLRELGQLAVELERLASAEASTAARSDTSAVASEATPVAPLAVLRSRVTAIDSAQQPSLAPLLVWVALVAVRARRRLQRRAGRIRPARDAFADNIVAWNAARRAARGRFRID
jgi:hypothetical protein